MEYDDERVFMLSDWWHTHEPAQEARVLSRNFTWVGDAGPTLTNGRAVSAECGGGGSGAAAPACRAECAGMAVTEVTAGKRYRFRAVTTDGTLVEPLEVGHMEINAGQRVIFQYAGAAASAGGNLQLDAKSLATDGSALPVIPGRAPCGSSRGLRPAKEKARMPAAANRTISLTGEQVVIDGRIKSAVNSTAFRVPEKAMLRSAYDGTVGRLPGGSRPIGLSTGEVVDVVLGNAAGLNGHLHGHSFWDVGRGAGAYDPASPDAAAAAASAGRRPLLRDTVIVYPSDGAYFQPPLDLGTPCGWVVRFVAQACGPSTATSSPTSPWAWSRSSTKAPNRRLPLPAGYPVWIEKPASATPPQVFTLIARDRAVAA
ncbi:MAG: hypothetical protein BJ554DRAFT_2345 [Olpidium bornovanus]|uniref:Plastocyanin-like domain-containing protein n=1 Tax=Olpidium bornovanus TaxID=278681 RepID=A0A8H8DGD4_9FUNG|nr:MAG: hypothetical protein BJ554DRAFT_2345 [Olpidium bornovanus]